MEQSQERPRLPKEKNPLAQSRSANGELAINLAEEALGSAFERAQKHASKEEPVDLLKLVRGVLATERSKRPLLEKLAAQMIRKEFGCGTDQVIIEAKLKDMSEIDFKGVQAKPPALKPPKGFDAEIVASEIDKRRLVDSMIHGAAQKLQNLFFMEQKYLDQIDPSLKGSYAKLSVFNDLAYWTHSEKELMGALQAGHKAGVVRLDFSGPIPKVKAEAICFPFLLHELGKGVMELLALHGLPQDKNLRQHVMKSADTLQGEMWDLRLGSTIWGKFLRTMDRDQADLRSALFREVVAMPQKDFHAFMRDMLSGDPKAQEKLRTLADKLRPDPEPDDEY